MSYDNDRYNRERREGFGGPRGGRNEGGPDAFFRWAESAGIPIEEMKKQMRDVLREGFRPNSPEWRRFFRQFFEGETPGTNGDGRRANVLSLRVDDKTLEAIDSLVEVGMFATRAESAAWLLQAGVAANTELFTRINATVAEIRRLREELQGRMNTAATPGSGPATGNTGGANGTPRSFYPKDDAPRTDNDAPVTPL